MGYPVWTHTSDKYQARAMREGEENKLSSENSELRKENEALKMRVSGLEVLTEAIQKGFRGLVGWLVGLKFNHAAIFVRSALPLNCLIANDNNNL